jgi:hypothetical protein
MTTPSATDGSIVRDKRAMLFFLLGAFLLATRKPSVGERDAFYGIVAGLAVMTAVWGLTATAFTWYVFIGATTTVATAWVLSRVAPVRG